jgi:hypothetical protein
MVAEMENDLRRLRPLTNSFDLVRGACSLVSDAVCREVQRFTQDSKLKAERLQGSSIVDVFEGVQAFANIPLTYFILPTRSEWSVLWYDCYLFNGYDSLCWNLTTSHQLETIHLQSSDFDSTMLRGNSFTHRISHDAKLAERSVYCSIADNGRWRFEEQGTALTAEDTSNYAAKRIADRLNETSLEGLLKRLGASPWSSEYYALGDERGYFIRRHSCPTTVTLKKRTEISPEKA